MKQIREVLRQKLVLKRSHREVARSVGISSGAVASLLSRNKKVQLTWADVEKMTDDALEERFYGPRLGTTRKRPPPDCAWINHELKRPGVTLELLHLEYLEKHVDGYRYSRFCELYGEWLGRHRLSMRQPHRAGEKLFLDYSGKKLSIVDATTGEVREVELFVAVMGASSYVFAEATWTQQLHDFVGSTVRALEYIGGVPELLVPDQLKSGVSTACRYEPGVNLTYNEMAEHYGCAVLPARPAKPKDKAKVERGVQIVQRWVLARLRNRIFHTLTALNAAIAELVDAVNARRMRLYGKSRLQLFDELDRPALKALPSNRYQVSEWKKCKVNIDYHVDVFGHFYSVPHSLVGEVLEARATATAVEIFRKGQRVASHLRSSVKGRHTTVSEHMPKSHQAHAEWSPSRFLAWALKVGPSTHELIDAILKERPHPEMGYRSCLGILRLAKRFGDERLERACARAVRVRARSYRHVANILENGLDAVPPPSEEQQSLPILAHENLRGRDYYH